MANNRCWGLVQGWNNLRDNNDKKSLMGALRWRTADMQTWIDYEFILGDEQNDSFSDVQAPTSQLVSADGQFKQQHSLNGWIDVFCTAEHFDDPDGYVLFPLPPLAAFSIR